MTSRINLVQHFQRIALHNEIHARPPESMAAPLAISHVVMVCDALERDASRAHVADLLRDHHLAQPDVLSTHLRMDVGPFRLRWEMHTEFVTYTFIHSLDPAMACAQVFARDPVAAVKFVPQDWFSSLPGNCLVSLHLWVLPSASDKDGEERIRQVLFEDTLVASSLVSANGEVYTDFNIHPDGFSRMVVLVKDVSKAKSENIESLSPRHLGRLVQRLLEIETYRMAALMGLPIAREAADVLAVAESELASLAGAIRSANRSDEPELLDRLTRLAGQVESQYAATHSRFSASAAYFELVEKRIRDIDESRLGKFQTIREFMDRRLTPARSTCEWSSRRQEALSQRVSRMSNLLRTRVEIEQQQSSQALLTTMNNRQGLQLQMQATVEGLSVAAITYYIVGLVSYIAKGAHGFGWPWSPEVTAAVAIPFVAFGVWWSLQRLHLRLFGERQ